YQYLSATLSQVGSHPARPNINSFSGALSTCPVLFVAGYSDNDWDIFPIVARRMMHLIRQVIWVQHASKEEMQKRILKLQVRSLLNERIIPWIRNTQENSILLIGPVDQFLNDLMKELGVRYLEPINNRKQENLPDASRFISPETVVSLAILIQQSGILSEALLRWLVKHPVVRGNPVLEWKVHDLIGHSRHTWGRINDAIKHTREVIRIKKAYLGPNAIANDLIWLGYEYLCLAKHPGLVRSLFIPLSLIKGLRLLAKGARISDNDSNHLKALSKYYQADLLHGWANAFMMFGQNSIFLTRPLLKMVDWMYDRIEIESDLMDNEYYWLRHLEIHLLLGKTIDREQTEKILSETENSYQLVQNNVQLGNIAAYRGLMSFLLDKDDKAASKYLDRAEELWLRVADNVASGRRRILVFRRLIGSITFWQAISLFLRDAS
ncbi:MAG: hypothetical protein JW947_09580, partial [Sedimentisphaerales bacterium]|nr:hypothetical protein [Sedimentisphaerales bacterium]